MVDNNYKILIVDDEPENIEILFTILSTLNFDFFVATDGKTCLDILQNEIPSAIIMDWEMPGLSGIETIKQIRTNEKTKNIPIIMATGKMTSSENLETALSAGANDFIRKPYDKIEIIARIKSMIHLFEENQKIIELEKQILQIEIDNTNNELEGNRKKLTTSTLKLIQNQEKNSLIIEGINKLKAHSTEQGHKQISEIISAIKVNSLSYLWKEFELVFEKVHTSFYENLNNKYDNLTPNEVRLCAFMKLNLTSKEISAITFSNENTIKKAKNRLRKKLRIDSTDNMSYFIQNF